MSAGRPSKYTPEFCERVIDAGSEGKTITEMADDLDIARSTIYEWIDTYPEFSDAIKRGLQKAQAWWERNGRLATFGGVDGYNATSYIFQMKNRFPDDWRDKQEREHTGANGGPIKIETRNQSLDDLIEEAKRLGIDPAAFGAKRED